MYTGSVFRGAVALGDGGMLTGLVKCIYRSMVKWIYRSVVKCIYRSMVKWTGKCTCNPATSMNPPPPNCVQCISRTMICRSFPCLTHRIQYISCIMSHSFPCLIHRVQCTSVYSALYKGVAVIYSSFAADRHLGPLSVAPASEQNSRQRKI